MDEKAHKRLQEAFVSYGDGPIGVEGKKLNAILKDFLENGPGTRAERLEFLVEQFQRLDIEYKDFFKGRH